MPAALNTASIFARSRTAASTAFRVVSGTMKKVEPEYTSCAGARLSIAAASRPIAAASDEASATVFPNVGVCCVIQANDSLPSSTNIITAVAVEGFEGRCERPSVSPVRERERGADRRMSGKRCFGRAGEDADAMIGARLLRRKDEGALREIDSRVIVASCRCPARRAARTRRADCPASGDR
jgi:hypothetical protein